MNLLNVQIQDDESKHLVDFLCSIWDNDFGADEGRVDSIAGGRIQCLSYMDSMFAIFMALILICTEDALEKIKEIKDQLLAFVRRQIESEEGLFKVLKYG